MTSAITGMIDILTRRRNQLRATVEASLEDARRSGREDLNATETAMLRDLRGLDRCIEEQQSELARARTIGIAGTLSRSVNSGARVAPLGFDSEELRHAHERLMTGEPVRLEARAFASASSMLPAELAPWVTEMQHEGPDLGSLARGWHRAALT